MNTNNLLSMSKSAGEGGDDNAAIQAAMLQNVNSTAAMNGINTAVNSPALQAQVQAQTMQGQMPAQMPSAAPIRFSNHTKRFRKNRRQLPLPRSAFYKSPSIRFRKG